MSAVVSLATGLRSTVIIVGALALSLALVARVDRRPR